MFKSNYFLQRCFSYFPIDGANLEGSNVLFPIRMEFWVKSVFLPYFKVTKRPHFGGTVSTFRKLSPNKQIPIGDHIFEILSPIIPTS